MGRNVVICCDGTNNEFGPGNTNVVRLIHVRDRNLSKQQSLCGRRYQPNRWNQRYCQDPECRRLHEIEKLSTLKIARRLNCSRDTVARALRLDQPPTSRRASHNGILDPSRAKSDALVAR